MIFIVLLLCLHMHAIAMETLPEDPINTIVSYIDYSDRFSFFSTNQKVYGTWKSVQDAYKKAQYSILEEKLSQLERPMHLHDCNIYWHEQYGTFFFKEKLNEKDMASLKEMKDQDQAADGVYIGPLEKYIGFIQGNIVQYMKMQLRDLRLINNPTLFCSYAVPLACSTTLYIPNGFQSDNKGINTMMFDCKLCKIQDSYIDNNIYGGRLWYYPRLLEAQFSFHFLQHTNNVPYLKRIFGSNTGVSCLKHADNNYKQIINENFSLSSALSTSTINEKLIRLFSMHTGDWRQNIEAINTLLAPFYNTQCTDNKQVCSVDIYCKRVREKLYKVPVNEQTKHIDDFELFKKELLNIALTKETEYVSSDAKDVVQEDKTIVLKKTKEILPISTPLVHTNIDTVMSTPDIRNHIFSYLSQDLFDLRLLNKSWYNYITQYKPEYTSTYKQELYNTLKDHLLKLKIPKTLDVFNIYWHGRLGTFFLKEKLNENNIATLKKIKANDENGNEAYSCFKKYVCAINKNSFIKLKVAIDDVRILDKKEQPLLYTMPLFDQKTDQILWCDPFIDYKVRATVYIPSQHIFRQLNIDIRPEGRFCITQRLIYYPRLLCAYANLYIRKKSDDTDDYYIIDDLDEIDGQPINQQYKKVLRRNFELSSELGFLTKKDDILTRLFMLHSGDGRPSYGVNKYVQLYYCAQWPWYKRLFGPVCSVKEYTIRIQDRFFKMPITQQKEHIDDFDQFKEELLNLTYKDSKGLSTSEQKKVYSYKETIKGYCASMLCGIKLFPPFLYKPIRLLQYCYTLFTA